MCQVLSCFVFKLLRDGLKMQAADALECLSQLRRMMEPHEYHAFEILMPHVQATAPLRSRADVGGIKLGAVLTLRSSAHAHCHSQCVGDGNV